MELRRFGPGGSKPDESSGRQYAHSLNFDEMALTQGKNCQFANFCFSGNSSIVAMGSAPHRVCQCVYLKLSSFIHPRLCLTVHLKTQSSQDSSRDLIAYTFYGELMK